MSRHSVRCLAATRAASALLAGDAAPALPLLQPWRFHRLGDMVESVLTHARSAPLDAIGDDTLAATLDAELPSMGGPHAAFAFHGSLRPRRARFTRDRTAELAWVLAQLSFMGEELENWERSEENARFRSHARDGRCAALWRAWTQGARWEVFEEVEELLAPLVRATVRVVMAHAPIAARRDPVEEASNFVVELIAGQWRELAIRVLETTRPSAIEALTARFDERRFDRAAACTTRPGALRDTAVRLSASNGQSLRRRLTGPDSVEAFADVHVAHRLLANWSRGAATTTEGGWRLVRHTRQRLTARLRAIALEGNLPLDSVATVDGCWARTEAALRRMVLRWSWRLVDGGEHETAEAVTRPCAPDPVAPLTLSVEDLDVVRTLVLLLVLRGQAHSLRRWVRGGRDSPSHSTFYRHLRENLPARMGGGASDGWSQYGPLRAQLGVSLEDILDEQVAVLQAVASLTDGRDQLARFRRIVEPRWRPEIRMPRHGLPTMREHARLFVQGWWGSEEGET